MRHLSEGPDHEAQRSASRERHGDIVAVGHRNGGRRSPTEPVGSRAHDDFRSTCAAAALAVASAALGPRALPAAPRAARRRGRAARLRPADRSFAFDVRPVDAGAPPTGRPPCRAGFLLASTDQGRHLARRARPARPATTAGAPARTRPAPVVDGRLAGDLVIVGGPVGLTGNELRRWFRQMRAEGLADDRRQHRPRRRRAAARARPEAGAGDRAASAPPTRRSTRAPTTAASCSSRCKPAARRARRR